MFLKYIVTWICVRRKLEKLDRLTAAPVPVKRKADSSAVKLPVMKRMRLASITSAIDKPLPATTVLQPVVTDVVVGKSSENTLLAIIGWELTVEIYNVIFS